MARLIAAVMAVIILCAVAAGEIEWRRGEHLRHRTEAEHKRAPVLLEIVRQSEAGRKSVSQPVSENVKTNTYDPCSLLVPAVVAEWNNCYQGHKNEISQAKTEIDPPQRQTQDQSASNQDSIK